MTSEAFDSLFADEQPTAEEPPPKTAWRVLLVDDEPDIHAVLRLVLQGEIMQGRPLELLDARSAAEAKTLLQAYPDIALILLDVVMETEAAGLDLVKYIRHQLGNEAIQIILVTGQPGYAPQRQVVVEYDIDGYRLKSELTSDRIFVSVNTALRAFRALSEREEQERRLRESEQRYLDLYDHSPDMYASVDAETGRIIRCNQTLADSLGYEKSEILGRPILDFYHPDCAAASKAACDTFLKTGRVQDTDLQVLRKDGTKLDVNVNVTAVRDDRGRILYSRTCWIDITERKRLEAQLKLYRQNLETLVAARTAALKETETRYRLVADYTSNWEIWISQTGEWLYCSPSCQRVTGYEADRFLKDPDFLFEIVHPEDRSQVQAHFTTSYTDTGPFDELVFRLRHADGRIVWIEHSCQPVYDDQGNHLGRRASNRDITKRVEDEAKLRAAKEMAEMANRAKSIFLANMSHELRTPLNAILGFAQLMQRDPNLTENQRENLATINRSGEHLLGLINDVLEISRIESGRSRLENQPFNFTEFLLGIEEMIRLRAEAKGLRFSLERDEHLPEVVEGDANKLRQVLINLLTNAVKFTERGSVSLSVTDRSEGPDETDIGFVVRDTGPGIPESEQERIFEPFVQRALNAHQGEGVGLGLAISRDFVRLLGGKLVLESSPGQGAIFRFRIPLKKIATQALRDERPQRHAVGLAPGQPEYRILIAEDHPDNQRLLCELLKQLGFQVRGVTDGNAALREFQSWRPHLIWMDMRMPHMDGFEATRRIKATPEGRETFIVALTASVFEEDRTQVLAAGCDDFVRKPLREQQIVETLRRLLGVRFLYEEENRTPSATQVQLDPQDLAVLSDTQRKRFIRAAEQLDLSALQRLIDEISPSSARLAKDLKRLVDDFRFDRILEFLEAAGSSGRSH